MTLKASAYYAASLDGYIARPDGSIDWLNGANAIVPEGEDCGFQAFLDSIDALVMGRKTFEQNLSVRHIGERFEAGPIVRRSV